MQPAIPRGAPSIIGDPEPHHYNYVPLPGTKPVPVDYVGASGSRPLTLNVSAIDGASVAAALAKPDAQAAIRDQISAAVLAGVAMKAAYERKREEARMNQEQARGFDAAFRARAEAAGWRVVGQFPCDGCGAWPRPRQRCWLNATRDHGPNSSQLRNACTPCLRTYLDARDTTGGFVPGNAGDRYGGFPSHLLKGADAETLAAAGEAPVIPAYGITAAESSRRLASRCATCGHGREWHPGTSTACIDDAPEDSDLALCACKQFASTSRTDDSPTEACVPFPPARTEWGYRATCAECGITRIHSDLAECPLVCIHCAPDAWSHLATGEQWWYRQESAKHAARAPREGFLIQLGAAVYRHLGGHAGNWAPHPASPAEVARDRNPANILADLAGIDRNDPSVREAAAFCDELVATPPMLKYDDPVPPVPAPLVGACTCYDCGLVRGANYSNAEMRIIRPDGVIENARAVLRAALERHGADHPNDVGSYFLGARFLIPMPNGRPPFWHEHTHQVVETRLRPDLHGGGGYVIDVFLHASDIGRFMGPSVHSEAFERIDHRCVVKRDAKAPTSGGDIAPEKDVPASCHLCGAEEGFVRFGVLGGLVRACTDCLMREDVRADAAAADAKRREDEDRAQRIAAKRPVPLTPAERARGWDARYSVFGVVLSAVLAIAGCAAKTCVFGGTGHDVGGGPNLFLGERYCNGRSSRRCDPSDHLRCNCATTCPCWTHPDHAKAQGGVR